MDGRAADRTADSGQETPAAAALTAKAAAVALGVHERTIRRAIARGELPAAKRAGVYEIAPVDLARYGARGRMAVLPMPSPRRDVPQLIPFPVPDALVAPALPRPRTSLVGRERELAAVGELVRDHGARLVTLVGPGGVGKTRLALAAAEQAATDFPEGIWGVALAPVRDPNLVAATIARSVGLVERADQSAIEALAAVIRDRRLLLVLDNFEHVVGAAPLVAELLTACPRLVVLITSRVRLNLSGEQVFAVPPLSSASIDSDAVRLFEERARAVDAAFRLTAENAAAVTAICARLDGLPLAIELAASRIRALSPSALLARLDQRLPLLTGGPRDLPERLQTMRNAIAWSYDLLPPAEQWLFRLLAVFAGGFTLEAAEAVCARGKAGKRTVGQDSGGQPGSQSDERSTVPNASHTPDFAFVLDGIAALVDASLVRQEGGSSEAPRYAMLETVREFAGERLRASGDNALAAEAHAAHFLALAERIAPALRGVRQASAAAQLEAELDNFRTALTWLLGREDATAALRLGGALWDFWHLRGHLSEGRRWLEDGLSIGGAVPAAVRANALQAAGHLARYQGDVERSAAAFTESIALYRELGDLVWVGNALLQLAVQHADRGDVDAAAAVLAEARAGAEHARAAAERERNDGVLSGAYYMLSAIAFQVGRLAHDRGDIDVAFEHYGEALGIARSYEHTELVAVALGGLGLVDCARGHLARAGTAFIEALALDAEIGDPGGTAASLANVAVLAAASGRPESAARLLGAADGLRLRIAVVPSALSQRIADERARSLAESALGATAFAAARTAGNELSLEDAVAEALDVAAQVVPAATSSDRRKDSSHGLTPREREVLQLLAEGRTDREIAEALFVSRHTAANHVASILAKLGVPSRAAAAAYAVRQGLV